MPKNKMICFRVSEKVKEIISKRWVIMGFASESEYITALLKADNPGMDPGRKLKGLKRRK